MWAPSDGCPPRPRPPPPRPPPPPAGAPRRSQTQRCMPAVAGSGSALRRPDELHRERLIVRLRRRRRSRSGASTDAARVENLDDHRRGRRGLQVVVDDRAGRRILGRRLVLLHRRALSLGGGRENRVRRLEQMASAPATVGASSCRSAPMSSRTQKPRPCVATIRSSSLIAEIPHRNRRQVQLQRLPGVAVVERHEDAALGAAERAGRGAPGLP